MKNLLSVATATLLLLIVSCSSEENDYTIDQVESVDLASDVYQDSNTGIYNGIFTTLDGTQRGSVEITIPADDSRSAEAKITLANDEIISLLTNNSILKDVATQNVTFGSGGTTLNFSVDGDGKNPVVNSVIINDLEGDVVIRKHTTRSPVVPIAGTYLCEECTGHPLLGTGLMQTFNLLMFTTPNGDSSFDTQTTLGMNVYNGTGMQSNCVASGTETICDLMGSFDVPGGPITWSGIHTFNNTMENCSGASGTWSFASSSFGTLTGTFVSDAACTSSESGGLFISEIADPDNNFSARFLEITNGSDIHLDISDYEIQLYSNANTDAGATFNIPDNTVLVPGQVYVIATDEDEFNIVYAPLVADIQFGSFNSNGDDTFVILDSTETIIDIYGTIGVDQTGTCAEFEDGRAERIAGTTSGSTTFDESEWIIRADSTINDCTDHANQTQNAPDDFNPGVL